MFLTFALILTSFLCWRVVRILHCRIRWKFLLTGLIFLISLKFNIMRFLGGGTFAVPELPVWILYTSTWLYSALFIFFLLILLSEIIRLPFRLKYKIKIDSEINLAVLILSLLLTSYGMWNGTRLPEIKEIKLHHSALPDNFKIALLADIHADGKLTKADRVQKMVEAVNRENPDVILIAGDFVDGSVQTCGAELIPLKNLKAKYGVFGVTGNHEYFSGYTDWMDFFKNLNIRILENEAYPLPCGAAVAGVPDPAALRYHLPGPDLLKTGLSVPDLPVILMAHRPGIFAEAAALKNTVLQVSGHTHGGMLYGFDRIVAAFNKGFVSGLYTSGEKYLYVSNGTGIWNGFPIRIGRAAEITVITNKRDN